MSCLLIPHLVLQLHRINQSTPGRENEIVFCGGRSHWREAGAAPGAFNEIGAIDVIQRNAVSEKDG